MRKQGLKPSHYSAREITGWAIVYLDEHPELIPEAIANARAMILRGDLGKRGQRALLNTECFIASLFGSNRQLQARSC